MYVRRLIGYLHGDSEPMSRSSASGTPEPKRTKRGFSVRGVRFRMRVQDPLEKLQNRWELFVIVDPKKKNVAASCLVQFNDIYGSCEIHEVCVAVPGKGYCKQLMGAVRKFIASGSSGIVQEIRIFCEQGNVAACKCYGSVFSDAYKVMTDRTCGYILKLKAHQSLAQREL